MAKKSNLFTQFQDVLIEKSIYTKVILCVFYLVGIIGFIYKPKIFQAFTPMFLLLNFLVLLIFQTHTPSKFIRFCIVIFVIGFAVELLGVATGKIFGYYHYGTGLGPAIKGIPFLIGLNWLILTYCAGQMTVKAIPQKNIFIKSFLGAIFMLLMDIFIEQVAGRLNMWYWDDGEIPPQNYLAWLFIAFFCNLIYHIVELKARNKLAQTVFILQLVFFITLSIKYSTYGKKVNEQIEFGIEAKNGFEAKKF